MTGQLSTFATGAKIIHADIDPAEISKNRVADVPIVGDAKEVIRDLVTLLTDEGLGDADYSEWRATTQEWKATFPLGYTDYPDRLEPQYVIERIGQLTGPEGVYVAGVGQHQMWAAQYVQYERPNAWLNSGGLGTMGYSVPAAMGAKVGEPGPRRVGDRRRRLLPDDQPGAGHLRHQPDPHQGGDHQQL